MTITDETYRLLLSLSLLAIALAILVLAFAQYSLLRLVRRAAEPTNEERISRLKAQVRVNRELVESLDGRRTLAKFFVSEAAIMGFFREIEETIEQGDADDLQSFVIERVEKKEKWHSKENLKKGAKALAGKLFDKANDFVKGYLPGANKD